ncbi:MAG: hypothetical protein WD872_04000, partial [Pirellulaceae bacterium]
MNDFWRQLEKLVVGQRVSAEPGGLETTIQPTWDLPPWLVLAVLGGSAIVLLAVYWRENASAARPWKVLLAGMRLCLVGIVLLMLYGWTLQRHRTDLPDVVVMLDDSASMAILDHYDDAQLAQEIGRRLIGVALDEASRLNLAKTLLLEGDGALPDQLAQRYNLKFYLGGG